VNYDSSKNELAGTLSAYATAIDGDGLALETPIQNTVDKNATPQLRYSVLGSNEKKLTAGLKAVAPDLSQTSNTYKKNTNNKNNSGY
jgi:CII-binding regulator of phage lambda lysogenization HflD